MTGGNTSVSEGLFRRVEELIEVAVRLPRGMSDEEVEGLLRFLPPDTSRSMRALLSPRFRDVSLDFMRMIGDWIGDVRRAKEEGRKVVLVPFNFPPEVIYMFRGAVPMTSEVLTTLGVSVLEGQGERYWDYAMGLGIPDFLCSSSTIELGSILTGSDFEPDIIVQSAPGACDANSKIHEFVALQMGIPQIILEKPTEITARGRELHRRYFMAFIRRLEEMIGEELEEAHMREVLEEANRAAHIYYELYDLRKFAPCPVPNIFSIFTYGTRFTRWGKPQAVETMRSMAELSRCRLENGEYPAGEEVARCLWLYIGYYFDFLGFFNWMEERGITYLNDILSLCQPRFVDTTNRETMLNGLAEVCFEYPMTRQMGADSMSLAWLEDMCYYLRDLGADCAIYSGHHACKQTWSIINLVRREIMARTGVPVLCLQGDSWIRRMTPVSVLQEEILSFVETVVRRRRKPSRGRGG